MNHRQRLIESTNRGFGSLGDEKAPKGVRHEVEDKLIQVLEDCIMGPNPGALCVNVKPFRDFIRKGLADIAGLNQDTQNLCLSSDNDCAATILYITVSLKRMQHRAEWAIDCLRKGGLPLSMIPDGQLYLGR